MRLSFLGCKGSYDIECSKAFADIIARSIFKNGFPKEQMDFIYDDEEGGLILLNSHGIGKIEENKLYMGNEMVIDFTNEIINPTYGPYLVRGYYYYNYKR